VRALRIEPEQQGSDGSIQVHLAQLWQSQSLKGIAVRTAAIIATLLVLAACATNRVDPLLIPPEANVDANDGG
jgi:hypothetical protein